MAQANLNPFNPQFGKRPQQFVGRDTIINDFAQSLHDANDPNRTTIITGISGSGKTAILTDVHSLLRGKKNLIIDVTARDGMLLAVLDEMQTKGKPWLKDWADGLSSFNVGALGSSSSKTERRLPWRSLKGRSFIQFTCLSIASLSSPSEKNTWFLSAAMTHCSHIDTAPSTTDLSRGRLLLAGTTAVE